MKTETKHNTHTMVRMYFNLVHIQATERGRNGITFHPPIYGLVMRLIVTIEDLYNYTYTITCRRSSLDTTNWP